MATYVIKSIVIFFIISNAITTQAGAFKADIRSAVSYNGQQKIGEVLINNNVIMRLYDTIEAQGPGLRADRIAQRLTQMVALGLDPKGIQIKYADGFYRGIIHGRMLFTVGSREAELNKNTPDMLATEWATSVREQLKDMPVSEVTLDGEMSKKPQLPEFGDASWFDNGDSETLQAVHPALPLGTKVRVRNVSNGWTVVVEIVKNEGLPKGRIINLTEAAGRAIGIIENGVAKVKLSKVN